jgi:hypothetical protein
MSFRTKKNIPISDTRLSKKNKKEDKKERTKDNEHANSAIFTTTAQKT